MRPLSSKISILLLAFLPLSAMLIFRFRPQPSLGQEQAFIIQFKIGGHIREMEAPRLKAMSREIAEKLHRMGGTWAKQGEVHQQALDHVRTASDREEAFMEVVKGIDMALERSRGLKMGR